MSLLVVDDDVFLCYTVADGEGWGTGGPGGVRLVNTPWGQDQIIA